MSTITGEIAFVEPTDGSTSRAQGRSPFDRILGRSSQVLAAIELAKKLAESPIPVLIQGETGVGKELFAQAIHEVSPNRSGPFIPINCGALSRELAACELFGYVDGAFTGARRGGIRGKLEAAEGGTVFLDELGELPHEVQPQLLRVLEERQVYRVGETRPRRVRFRLLAATNANLREETSTGRFRRDLFYRIAASTLSLPALRDRPSDIELYANHFVTEFARRMTSRRKPVDSALMRALVASSWPGNVRELRNVIESMCIVSRGDSLSHTDLPPEFSPAADRRPRRANEPPAGPAIEISADPRAPEPRERLGHAARTSHDGRVVEVDPVSSRSLLAAERQAIRSALSVHDGNVTQAAESLGIARSTLYLKLRKHRMRQHW